MVHKRIQQWMKTWNISPLFVFLLFILLVYLYWVSFPQLEKFKHFHEGSSFIYPQIPFWKLLVALAALLSLILSFFRGSTWLTLVFLCAFGLSLYAINYNLGFMVIDSDAWVYPAYVDNVFVSVPPPPLFSEEGTTDPRYGPLIVVLGLLAKTGISSKTLILALPVVVLPLLCGSLFLVTKKVFDEKTGLITTVVSFFFWGPQILGFHSYAVTEVWIFYYSSIFSLACLFLAVYFFLTPGKKAFILSVIFGFLCCASYLISGVFLGLFILVLSFKQQLKPYFKKTFFFFGILAVLVILWPWYSLIENVLFYSSEYSLHLGNIVSWQERMNILFAAAGIGLVGAAGFVYLVRKKSIAIPVLAGLSFCCVVSPLTYNLRFIVVLMFCFHIGWALLLQRLQKRELLVIGIVIVLILSISGIQRNGMSGFTYKQKKIPPDLEFLQEYTEPGSVIISDRYTEYLVVAQAYRKTTQVNRNVEDPLLDQFFLPGLSSLRRKKIINTYDIDYILVNTNIISGYIVMEFDSEFERIYSDNICILYAVNS